MCVAKGEFRHRTKFGLIVPHLPRMDATMTQPAQNPLVAALLTVLASAFAAGTTLLAKALGTGVLGPSLHPLQISHGRFLFALLVISTAVALLRPQLTRPSWTRHAARSVLGWGGVTMMFAAATFIPLSDATAISFLNPVFGMVFAALFLRERVGPRRWGSAVVALLGAAILMRPGAGALQTGALLALVAALLLGMELVFVKQLSGRERPLQVLLVNNGIGLTISTLAVLPVWIAPTTEQWLALAGIGVLMASAQACFVNAMRLADASFASPFFYTTLVFAALYDGAVFAIWPDTISQIGAATILAGAAYLAWREAHVRKR